MKSYTINTLTVLGVATMSLCAAPALRAQCCGGMSAPVGAACALQTTNSVSGQAVMPYPLKHCIVSGEKLGEMGDPVTLNYHGQEMKFCCNDCVKKFNKDPQAYLKKLGEEQARQ